MKKIRTGIKVLAAMIFAASIMLASCKYDTEPEDSKKNEQTGTKLSIVWDNWASKNDILSETDGVKKVFISTMLYGTQTLPDTYTELPRLDREGQFDSMSLDKYETEYRAKLGIGDRYFSEETVYEFDTAKRYMNNRNESYVYICYFKYYSDKDYTNEITLVEVSNEDVTVYAYAFYETKIFANLI